MTGTTRALRDRDGDSDEIVLAVLDAVERDHQITQRTVAQELGIALGLANAYLKRCVRKGLIKVQQVPRRRYAYYLTPHGFTEKSRLMAQYLSHSFAFFRRARTHCGEQFAAAHQRGWRRVALFGAGDLAEIAMLCARQHDVELVGIVDAGQDGAQFLGVPVAATLAGLGPVDAALVVDLTAPQAAFDAAVATLGAERVLVPEFLRIRRVASAAPVSA
ncbi:MAG: winged helix-turn-helix transcriptional regulator [Alphaproteobacteria bacterium]|nr:winged helix-turn-helix transcriptional regulator [Alphaproteobacteria bacterium]